MKYFNFLSIIFLVACSSSKFKSENVHVEIVQRSSISIDGARTKLIAHQCSFRKNIIVIIPAGDVADESRLMIAIRTKTMTEGGNAVITSLIPYNDGTKNVLKGMIYNCPEDHPTEHV